MEADRIDMMSSQPAGNLILMEKKVRLEIDFALNCELAIFINRSKPWSAILIRGFRRAYALQSSARCGRFNAIGIAAGFFERGRFVMTSMLKVDSWGLERRSSR